MHIQESTRQSRYLDDVTSHMSVHNLDHLKTYWQQQQRKLLQVEKSMKRREKAARESNRRLRATRVWWLARSTHCCISSIHKVELSTCSSFSDFFFFNNRIYWRIFEDSTFFNWRAGFWSDWRTASSSPFSKISFKLFTPSIPVFKKHFGRFVFCTQKKLY